MYGPPMDSEMELCIQVGTESAGAHLGEGSRAYAKFCGKQELIGMSRGKKSPVGERN